MLLQRGTLVYFKGASEGVDVAMLFWKAGDPMPGYDAQWFEGVLTSSHRVVVAEDLLDGTFVQLPALSDATMRAIHGRYKSHAMMQKDIDDLFAELNIDLDLDTDPSTLPAVTLTPALDTLRAENNMRAFSDPCWRCGKPLSVIGNPPQPFCGPCETALEKIK